MSCSLFRALALAAALTVAPACSDDAADLPTTPTPVPITETFSGTLTINGAATHTFSTSTAGSVTVTLTSVGPDNTVLIGLSLGTWNGTACATVLANDTAVQNAVLLGNVSTAGQLCVRVYDVGRFTEPTTYEVTVVHP